MTRAPIRLCAAAMGVCGSLLLVSGVHAQTVAVGSELQVNSYTTDGQERPAVATEPDGGVVVVWQSDGSDDTDTSSSSIQGQRYDDAGNPIGAQFQVNSYTTSLQSYPAVATGPSGGFVVVWQSNGSDDTDTSSRSVQGQRYDGVGNTIGGEFQVNSFTTSSQSYPAVAVGPSGAFVVAWQSFGSDDTDTSSNSIQGQRYDDAGNPIGVQFQVNSYTTNSQNYPAVAVGPSGGFVVVWQSDGSVDTDTSSRSVQGQRYDDVGNTIGVQFQVNSYTTSSQSYPAVAVGPSGAFVVAWHSRDSSGADPSDSIQGQRYDHVGNTIGGEFQVNSYTTNGQYYPAVATDADGDFVVVWQSRGSSGTDSSAESIQGQRYDADGNTIGSEFQVNSYTTDNQYHPVVAAVPEGDFVVVWQSDGSSGSDTSYDSIQRQRYRVTGDVGDRVFVDLDFDGLQDSGETGIAAIPVYLVDAAGVRLTRSTTTDAQGLYGFKAKAGQHYLQFERPPIYSFTAQDQGNDDTVDSDADALTGTTEIFDVVAAGDHTEWDAGMANGIGDRVWLDLDANGIQDGAEPGLGPGVPVELVAQPGGSVAAITSTDGDGRYRFHDLDPGDYALRVGAPAGGAFTLLDAGSDELVDSDVDPLTGATASFTFETGDLDPDWDAGIVTSVTIGDRVWLDDGNGIQDAGERGWSGVTVHLRDASDAVVDTATTDGNGFFGFAVLPASYRLEIVLPSGFAFTLRDQGANDGTDSDVDPATGTTALFVLASGPPDLSRDAGLLALPFFADGFESGGTSAWDRVVP